MQGKNLPPLLQKQPFALTNQKPRYAHPWLNHHAVDFPCNYAELQVFAPVLCCVVAQTSLPPVLTL